jgi:hypothetical protein
MKNNPVLRRSLACSTLCMHVALVAGVSAQQNVQPVPLDWTAEQDHLDMQSQLGITALRPGPSGRDDAPNPANYDESIADRYPDWPDLLTLNNGQPVRTAADWWDARRPEIVAAFESEVIGRIPADVPDVEWTVTETADGVLAGTPVSGRQLVGRVDNSAYPAISVEMSLTLVLPREADGPVPVMVLFGGRGLEQAVGNAETPSFGGGGGGVQDPPSTEQLIAAGWGFAFLNPNSIQADDVDRGVDPVANQVTQGGGDVIPEHYSYLSADTGCARATSSAWPMTVRSAIASASAEAARNIQGSSSIR